MADMQAIREGLAAALVPLDGVQQSAYLLSQPTAPAAEVEPAAIDYDLTMRDGTDRWQFTVRVFVPFTTDIGGQKKLDTYIDPKGPSSIKALIEADRTLGGIVDHTRVTKCSGYKTYQRDGGGLVLGAEWTVEIIASN